MAQDWRTYVEQQQKKRYDKFISGLGDDRFTDSEPTFGALDPRSGYADLSFTPAKRRGRMDAPNLYDLTPEQYGEFTADYDAKFKPHELDKNLLRLNRFRYHPNLHSQKGLNEYLLNHPHLKGYIGDVDDDKIPDYVVTDSDGQMIYYNGYNMPNPKLWHKTLDKMTYMKMIMMVIKGATIVLKKDPAYSKQTQALKASGKRRNIGGIAGIIARHLIMRVLPDRYFTALAEAKRKQAENIGIPKEELHESAKLTKFEKYMIGAWNAVNKDPKIRGIFINLVNQAFGVEKNEMGAIKGFSGAAFQALKNTILAGDGTPLARELEKIVYAASTRTDYADFVVSRFDEELRAYGAREERRERSKRKKQKKPGYVAPVAREYIPYYGAQPVRAVQPVMLGEPEPE